MINQVPKVRSRK